MDTKIWDVREYNEDLQQYPKINEIKDIVLNGGLIGLPTETVYGLAANATDEEAVAKIYEAKGRPSDNPLIVHIHSKGRLKDFTYTLDPRVEKLMQASGRALFRLSAVKARLSMSKSFWRFIIGCVRMPSHSVGRQLLQIINEPLVAPSANLSGKRFTNNFQSCISRFEWPYRWYCSS
ncbi:L-threonylcarbamoyladenylate synthase [Staphylococcus aureus]